jgi:uncharacterized YigZ family protein
VSTSYLTVARTGEAEIEGKRSRFRCHVERVGSEDAARAVVERIRKQHWDARHHCSAFVLGPDAAVQRSNDDGEPSGTAGAPMLEVLRGREVSDVVAVVTRWFGGVLLGAGGLVRAYGDAVRVTLDEVGVRRRVLMQRYDVVAGHAEAGRLESELRARGVTVLGVDYATAATLHVAVPAGGADEAAGFAGVVAELTGGACTPSGAGTSWVDA